MDLLKATATIFPVFLFCTWLCLHKIHDANEAPYIDEEFHVPQVQRFCNNNFEWDPKITTPPGLYFASIFTLKLLSFVKVGDFVCNLFDLRMTNSIFTCLNFIILTWIYSKKNKNLSSWVGVADILSLTTFPILYFFSFLYYTDVISTFTILAMYCAYLHGKISISALFGFISLWMRQTNVIWVAFVAAIYGYKILENLLTEEKLSIHKMSFFTAIIEGLRRPKLIISIILKEIPYVMVGLSFVVFLLWNGSIVLGDKSAHQATIHLPQLFYYFLVCAAFSPALFLKHIPIFINFIKTNKIATFFCLLSIAAVVHFNTMAHPYLLADNRHYAFYAWKRLFQPTMMRFMFVPVYLFCASCMLKNLSHQGAFFQILFVLCVAASLVPQMLLEPRYFIIPFLMFKLNIPPEDSKSVCLNLLVSLFVNFVTIYVYIHCPFARESKIHFIW
ncbi:putative Dol-P-Glc:Glc(2)Man(9)GlcNAc(2)-PP-Dol alpha-1,2-glucosyltransferase [Neocloeon triangulifer]|uniref:putative Dol-P-Glc:Glc(2)Man(9)GlcNAc(2)-PP-Dol alpha-1,2-glucosyltransferase n=1 Tax=Neocloeon triangulifer TaxID=2078957 RepID=UPI00286F50B6|nr:putative Dol-P-Glc:Glc(2)Man(9)GlcNAc(2)-PP-Dol alpha-1,2-glucosyltransferase [Neocloeon triangulifer]